MDAKELKILLYSLELISEFWAKPDAIRSGGEFLEIHNRNTASLTKLSQERSTTYFIDKIKEYPSFTEAELDEFIAQHSKDKSLLSVYFGWLFDLFALIYKTAKTKGNNLGNTKIKLQDVKRINDSVLYVVKNPGFDELIKNSK